MKSTTQADNFPFYQLFYNFFLISDYEINYTKLFYSNFWTVSHLFSLRKTLLYIPDSTHFLVELTAKQRYKAKGAGSTLKRLETWHETNAAL